MKSRSFWCWDPLWLTDGSDNGIFGLSGHNVHFLGFTSISFFPGCTTLPLPQDALGCPFLPGIRPVRSSSTSVSEPRYSWSLLYKFLEFAKILILQLQSYCWSLLWKVLGLNPEEKRGGWQKQLSVKGNDAGGYIAASERKVIKLRKKWGKLR